MQRLQEDRSLLRMVDAGRDGPDEIAESQARVDLAAFALGGNTGAGDSPSLPARKKSRVLGLWIVGASNSRNPCGLVARPCILRTSTRASGPM